VITDSSNATRNMLMVLDARWQFALVANRERRVLSLRGTFFESSELNQSHGGSGNCEGQAQGPAS